MEASGDCSSARPAPIMLIAASPRSAGGTASVSRLPAFFASALSVAFRVLCIDAEERSDRIDFNLHQRFFHFTDSD